MGGRREYPAIQPGDASAGLDEVESPVEMDALVDAQPPVEVQQVHATAHQNVLAIIDQFARFGFRIGGCIGRPRCAPSAQKAARFEDFDFEVEARQCCRGREAGQSAADDDYFGQVSLWTETFGHECTRIRKCAIMDSAMLSVA